MMVIIYLRVFIFVSNIILKMNIYYFVEEGHYLDYEDMLGLIKWLFMEGLDKSDIYEYDDCLSWKQLVNSFF